MCVCVCVCEELLCLFLCSVSFLYALVVHYACDCSCIYMLHVAVHMQFTCTFTPKNTGARNSLCVSKSLHLCFHRSQCYG